MASLKVFLLSVYFQNLSENAIGAKGLTSLCEELSSHRFLTNLNLSANKFGDNDVKNISNMLIVSI